MHKLIAIAAAGLLISVFSLSGIAYAQVGVDVGGGTSVGGAGADVSADADASAHADVSSEDEASSDERDESGHSESAAAFSLSQKEAASASIDAEGAELGADSVITGEDLKLFVTSRMKRDSSIENIEASSDSVSIEYRKEARLLGFIPASIRSTAEVSSDGSVDIDYPWYRFLFSVGSTDEAELEARIGEIMAVAGTGAGFDARIEAQLVEALHAALRGSVSA